jgi:hypothetical protein
MTQIRGILQEDICTVMINWKTKDHIRRTQQSFDSIHKDITLGRHVSTSIKSSSGPQGIDPDI